MDDGDRRPVFGVLTWGVLGAVSVVGGVAAVLTGTPGAGTILIATGGSMVWYARRLRQRGVRW